MKIKKHTNKKIKKTKTIKKYQNKNKIIQHYEKNETNKENGLCYKNCRPEYKAVGPVCWKSCNQDIDLGTLCRNKCRDGYKEISGICYKNCSSGEKDIGLACVKK
jgi:hypothetical protein